MAKSFVCCTAGMNSESCEKLRDVFDWFIDELKHGIECKYISNKNLSDKLMEKTVLFTETGTKPVKDKEERRALLRSRINNVNVVIFGCGVRGYEAYKWIRHNGGQIYGFMDNNPQLWYSYIDDYLVIEPSEAPKLEDTLFLIANDKYADDIKRQLERMSVREDKICIFR